MIVLVCDTIRTKRKGSKAEGGEYPPFAWVGDEKKSSIMLLTSDGG